MQWSFSNNSQLVSFKANQEDGPRKRSNISTGFDSLNPTGVKTTTTLSSSRAEGFESSHKARSRIMLQDAMGSSTVRPPHLGCIPVGSHASIVPPPLGGIPAGSPASIVQPSNSIVGSTELRNASKPATRVPSQLTIFYAGSVCVYDVSPEKAQAIMLLAGNGNSATPNKMVITAQVEAPALAPAPRSSAMPKKTAQAVMLWPGNGHLATPNKTFTTAHVEAPVPRRSSSADGFAGNRFNITSSCPGLPSPISASPRASAQSATRSTGVIDQAQAISLLPGNGHLATPNKTVITALVEAPVPRWPSVDDFVGNRSNIPPSCPGLPSPISATPRAGAQSAARSTSVIDLTSAPRERGTIISTLNKQDPIKVVSSPRPVAATRLPPDVVPQARKASLARFLERRKERVMSASPYANKQSPECSTPQSNSRSFSTSTAGSCSLEVIN